MEDNFIQGSLFDDLELNELQTKALKENNTSSDKDNCRSLFRKAYDGEIIYLESIDYISNKAKSFFKEHNLSTVNDLINFDRNGGRSLIVNCTRNTYETIIRVITDYHDGILSYDKNYIPLKPFPAHGFKVIEENLSPSLLLYELSNRVLNTLLSNGIYTIGGLITVFTNYSIDTIPKLGDKSIDEIRRTFEKEKDNWPKCVVYEFKSGDERESLEKHHEVDNKTMNLLFFLPNSTYIKLKGLGIETLSSLSKFVCIHNIYDIPNISQDDINAITSVLRNKKDQEVNDILDSTYKAIEAYISQNVIGRNRDIFLLREQGETLERISEKVGVTRERVRQIVKKIINGLMAYTSIILNLELQDKRILSEDKIKMHFINGDNARIFIKVLTENNEIEYLDYASLFCKRESISCEEKLLKIVEENIPDSIELSKIMPKLEEEMEKENLEFIDLNALLNFLSSHGFYIYNTLVSRKKQKYRDLCLRLMEKYFPDGINLTQVNDVVSPDMEKLKSLMMSEYNYSLKMSNRVLHARLTGENDLILIDRSRFLPKSCIAVDADDLNKIQEVIESYPANQVYYRTLFDELKDYLLLNTNINNHHYLHGAAQYYFSGIYTFARDYLVKNNASFVPVPTEKRIEELIKTKNKSLSIEELRFYFKGFSDVMIYMPISNNPNIVKLKDNTYFLIDLLGFNESQFDELKSIIIASINKNEGYTNQYILYSEFLSSEILKTLKEKSLDSPIAIFSIAKYLLNQSEYDFNYPHISQHGKHNISSYQSFFKEIFYAKDTFSYDQYLNLVERFMVPSMVRDIVLRDLSLEYVRISRETYIKKEIFLKENSKLIDSIVEYVRLHLHQGYFSLINYDDFSSLESTNYEWNTFLLDSIISLSNKFDCFIGSHRDRRIIRTIVAEKGRYSSYAHLVASLLNNRGIKIISEYELKEFLITNNLHAGNNIPLEIKNSDLFQLEGDIWKLNFN